MKNIIDLDADSKKQTNLFGSHELDSSKIRVRPAEFARIIDCSKQAVSIWVSDGKITLGTDGRLNPGVAISQLLKNSNPSLLRARALKPLVSKLKDCELKINDLENQIIGLKDDVEFSEGAALEFIEMLDLINRQLLDELDLLSESSIQVVIHAFLMWLTEIRKSDQPDLMIIDFLQAASEALND